MKIEADRNIIWIILMESLFAFVATIVTLDVTTALIHSQGGGPVLVATTSTIAAFMLNGPQFFVPYFQRYISCVISGATLGQTLVTLGYVFPCAALAFTSSRHVLLVAAMGGVTAAALGNAFAAPFLQQMRIRLLPVQTRSKNYSTIIFFSAIAGAIGSIFAIPLLKAYDGPKQVNYMAAYAVASVFCALGTLCFFRMRDSNATPSHKEQTASIANYIHDLFTILRSNRNLRFFLLSECVNWISTLGITYFTFYAIKYFGEGFVPQCNLIRTAATLCAVPFVHWLFIQYGSRRLIILYYIVVICVFILFTIPPVKNVLLLGYAMLGCVTVLRINYLFHFISELCPDANKTHYYAICNGLVSPFIILGPYLGFLFLNGTGDNYRLLFGVATIPCVLALWIVWKFLRDPKRANITSLAA